MQYPGEREAAYVEAKKGEGRMLTAAEKNSLSLVRTCD